METDVLGCTTNQHLARKRCCCKLACSRDQPVLTFRQLDFKKNGTNTILIQNIYRNPQNSAQTADGSHCAVSDVEMQEHYDEFFEEVFTEMEEKYGEVEEMNVCDNLGDHLVGNVYVKFRREEDAEKAVIDLNNRWFNGQPIHAELSPVTDFREACCRQYEMGECTRGGFCNFMHLKPISRELRRELYGRRRKNEGLQVTNLEQRNESVKQLKLWFCRAYLWMNSGPGIDPGRGPVNVGLDPEIVVVEVVVVEEEDANAIGGGQEIVKDPVDSEPCHFYCMSARKCCSLTKQVHNEIFFKDGLLNKNL
ncbi:splicing factor U2AF 35 kDa subunit isoform X1 [Anas acuta]|uniref:U2 small nuclear RNA auxiliary factor 1 n=5 Tax=Anas TaxID=8835 RepID=A0A493U3M9_ANAPP|nr:splicing factor U2AF 35 kDa subunit isoform X1 [Anas platyrhynchos]|eukprot:XP_027304529.1 splicing factor U2AF 35 kDa subunit isoform X1 [Anas platyrhynchos]